MPRPRRVSDEQILSALRSSVLAHGPQVSLERVAQELGVTQPALLKRFGSKKALMVAALLPQEPPRWLETVERGPDTRPLREQLEEFLLQIARYGEQMVPCYSALRESGIDHDELFSVKAPAPPVVALEALTAWLTRAGRKGLIHRAGLEVENAAAAMLGSIHARIHVSHLIKRSWTRASLESYVGDLAELYSRALAAPATSRRVRRKSA